MGKNLMALLHEARERLESLLLALEFGCVDEMERAELVRKGRITVERLRDAEGGAEEA